MPIERSTNKIRIDTVGGKLHVLERHIDQNGDLHENHYRPPIGYDTDQALIDNAVLISESLISGEKESIFQAMVNGADPTELNIKHLTNPQKYKQVLRAMMTGRVDKVIKVAELVNTITDNQILNHFTTNQLTKIRKGMDYILNNKAVIQGDDREDLD